MTTHDSSQPIDFQQLRAAQAEHPKAPAERKQHLNIGRLSLPLVKVLTPYDMIELQEAQDSGNLRDVIEVIPRLVPKQYQEQLRDYLMSDPDDEADRIDFLDVSDEFAAALEALTARPTDR